MTNEEDQTRVAKNGDEGMSDAAKIWLQLAPFLGLGWFFLVAIGVLGWAGWWLDGQLGSGRKFFVTGCVLGIGLGFVNLFKVVLVENKGKKK